MYLLSNSLFPSHVLHCVDRLWCLRYCMQFCVGIFQDVFAFIHRLQMIGGIVRFWFSSLWYSVYKSTINIGMKFTQRIDTKKSQTQSSYSQLNIFLTGYCVLLNKYSCMLAILKKRFIRIMKVLWSACLTFATQFNFTLLSLFFSSQFVDVDSVHVFILYSVLSLIYPYSLFHLQRCRRALTVHLRLSASFLPTAS